MDVGTISIVLVLGLIFLLAIGMPLGFASAALALLVMIMKFEPGLLMNPLSFGEGMLTGRPGSGALYLLTQKIFDLMTEYVLLSVPLFIFMAALLERSGVAKEMYNSLDVWLSKVRGGIAIVTSLMAVIMAAMSGIIGGEVVLLGLIALPQMLRLGYNQNLAIGTICASGSLGTMIPPSIVLIIFGLITETSIKALFTAAFVPGFMLASMIMIYILVRTRLNPSLAPLPEDSGQVTEDFDHWGTSRVATIYLWVLAGLAGLQFLGIATNFMNGGLFGASLMLIFAVLFAWMSGGAKGTLFLTFMHTIAAGFIFVLLLRALFFTVTGQNILEEGEDPIALGMISHLPYLGVALVVLLAILVYGFGTKRIGKAWGMGKGLVPPIIVIGAVLGSIYGGITGITEAAGMGALAVFLLSIMMDRNMDEWKTFAKTHSTKILTIIGGTIVVAIALPIILGLESRSLLSSMVIIAVGFYWCVRAPGKAELLWDGLMRTLRSTGTIIWVTIGAAALAGAYTLAGGPVFIANMIVGSDMPTMGVILVMMIIFLFMGAFMDWVGIVLLIIPVFLPIVVRLPIEEIGLIGQLEPKHVAVWFGVLFCMNMQVSFLSPPFGPAAFYLKSVAPPHISLTDIFKGFLPFICVQLLALTVMLVWPPIVTLLL